MKKYRYVLAYEVNVGTADEPVYQTFYTDKTTTDEKTAKAEAYNGEVTVEEVPMTDEETRALRDKLLAETDWTQTLDAPISTASKEAFRVYRQALRDVPQQAGFPETIVWPVLPGKKKAAPDPVDEAVEVILSGATEEVEA